MTLRTKARLRIWDRRFLNGHPDPRNAAVRRFIMRAYLAGLVVTSTSDGRHATHSYHYSNQAADVAGQMADMLRFQRAEARWHRLRYMELFGPDNHANVKNGRRITLVEGSPLENLHDNHVHGAPRL